jgi:hypothetical protein
LAVLRKVVASAPAAAARDSAATTLSSSSATSAGCSDTDALSSVSSSTWAVEARWKSSSARSRASRAEASSWLPIAAGVARPASPRPAPACTARAIAWRNLSSSSAIRQVRSCFSPSRRRIRSSRWATARAFSSSAPWSVLAVRASLPSRVISRRARASSLSARRCRSRASSAAVCRSRASVPTSSSRCSAADARASLSASFTFKRPDSSRASASAPDSASVGARSPAARRSATPAISSVVRLVRLTTESFASASARRSLVVSASCAARSSAARRRRPRSSSISSAATGDTRAGAAAVPLDPADDGSCTSA